MLGVCSAASRAVNLLAKDDKDDLYFEGGQVRTDFLKHLASGRIPAAFLSHMVRVSSTAQTALWKELVTAAFAALKSFSFVNSLEELQGQLAALSVITADPTLLRLVAAMLMAEVVEVNKAAASSQLQRGWESKLLFYHLLNGSGWADPQQAEMAAVRGSNLPGMLPEALKDVRGYPGKRWVTPRLLPLTCTCCHADELVRTAGHRRNLSGVVTCWWLGCCQRLRL